MGKMSDEFKNANWNEYKGYQGSNTAKLTPGAHVIQIKKVVEFDTYATLYVDIVSTPEFNEGQLTNFFTKTAKPKAEERRCEVYDVWFNSGKFNLYFASRKDSETDKKAKNVFKSRITAIEESNPGYNFEESGFEGKSLEGKYAVGVWQEEEYIRQDGNIGIGLNILTIRSFDALRNGEIDIPARKKLKSKNYDTVNEPRKTYSRQPYQAPKIEEEDLPTPDFDDEELPF